MSKLELLDIFQKLASFANLLANYVSVGYTHLVPKLPRLPEGGGQKSANTWIPGGGGDIALTFSLFSYPRLHG